jgi:anti-sigma factor RsiW
MTSTHDEILELAASAIDFELSPAERSTLSDHLRDCVACARRVTGMQADQRAIAQLPQYSLAQGRVDRVARRIGRAPAGSGSQFRLVAVAALLALLALGALAVGAELLRRQEDPNLSVVPPGPSATATATEAPTPVPTPVPVASATATSGPVATASPRPGTFTADTIVQIVVDGLRVRTAPTVDGTTSAKLDPTLGPGTRLQIIDGPVTADDYDWYLVQAIGWPHRGWVAAADHDGSPWIADPAASSPTPSMSTVESAIADKLRDDVAATCVPRREKLPAASALIKATAGVECKVATALVARVGAYSFPDAKSATATYLGRMDSYDVAKGSGDCTAGKAGDAPWRDPDGKVGGRTGCFLDENGTANVRVACGPMYVGILGRGDDIAALYRWVWAFGGQPGDPDKGGPPGICRPGT